MTMASTRGLGRTVATAVAMISVLAGCVTLPPAKPVADVRSVVGNWEGYGGSGRLGYGPIHLTIKDDGSVDGFLPRVGPSGTPFAALVKPNGGRLIWDSATSTGTLTLHEGDGRRVLKGETTRKDQTDAGWFEVSPVR